MTTEPTHVTSSHEPVQHLRLERRALRAERDRISWWRRLVRARMDLAVASAAGPDLLGEEVAFVLPIEVCLEVPRPSELQDVLPALDPAHEVGMLSALRQLDERLAAYEAGVVDALAETTSRLMGRLEVCPHGVVGERTAVADGA